MGPDLISKVFCFGPSGSMAGPLRFRQQPAASWNSIIPSSHIARRGHRELRKHPNTCRTTSGRDRNRNWEIRVLGIEARGSHATICRYGNLTLSGQVVVKSLHLHQEVPVQDQATLTGNPFAGTSRQNCKANCPNCNVGDGAGAVADDGAGAVAGDGAGIIPEPTDDEGAGACPGTGA
eukprot:1020165-Amphidinium_carterae.1